MGTGVGVSGHTNFVQLQCTKGGVLCWRLNLLFS